MSSVGVFNVDLLTDIPLPAQDGGRGQQGTSASLANGGEASEARDLSGRSAQVSEGTFDLLGDCVQPLVSPVTPVTAAGGPLDLLGDEIVEHDSAHRSPGGPQTDAGITDPPASEGVVCMGLEPAGCATQDSGAEHPSGIPSAASVESPEGASINPAAAPEPSRAAGAQLEVPAVSPETTSPGSTEAASSLRVSDGGSREHATVADHQANSASAADQQLLLQHTSASKDDTEEGPAPKPAHSSDEPALAADDSTEPGVALLSGEAPAQPAAELSDGSAPVGPDGDGRGGGGGGSQSLPSDDEREPGTDKSEPLSGHDSEPQTGPGSEGDERAIDSDREVVEEEDAFGDFADFTSASHFLPGGGSGAPSFGAPPPPPSASAAAAARAAGGVPSSASSPSSHRHAHLGSMGRPGYGMMGGGGGGAHHGAASVSAAASEHGSLAGEFSDFSHQSPPPSVAPSRGGGGRKSVASIASVGSRAGGDDDLGDYGSVVGSSVWRVPSQMATSSYAAAAGADDDFGDFTSDITSTSDFAPSTQPPSAVAVSGPGSVHPDDDFGSFASHRSTADDDEDDFGNFNAAPAPGAAGTGAAGGSAGAGPSGSGTPAAARAAGGSGGAGPSGFAGTPAAAGAGVGPGGAAAAAFSPRDATGAAVSHPYHSTQSVAVAVGSSGTEGAGVEAGLLQLPPAELRQAVVRALQPLLPAGVPTMGPPQFPDGQVVSAAWAQLCRHMAEAGGAGGGGGVLQTGVPLPALPGGSLAADGSGAPDGGAMGSRSGYTAVVKLTRPLRWKGSDSERRLLAGLGLGELAAQARLAEAAEGPRPVGSRGRMDSASLGSGGVRQMGPLASFGDTPRRTRADMNTNPAGQYRDTECDSSAAGSNGRSRGLDQSGESYGALGPDQGAGFGATPRGVASGNGVASGASQGK